MMNAGEQVRRRRVATAITQCERRRIGLPTGRLAHRDDGIRGLGAESGGAQEEEHG